MAKARTKILGQSLPVPQSREEAASHVRRIGEIGRELTRREADMNDGIARIKETCETMAEPLRAESRRLTEGLQMYCEANRAALTGGKVKFADLGTGIVRWAFRAASVKGVPRDADKLAELIARIETAGLGRFIRTKKEIDKEALRAEPETAKQIRGISVASDGEDFVVEPFEAQLAGAA